MSLVDLLGVASRAKRRTCSFTGPPFRCCVSSVDTSGPGRPGPRIRDVGMQFMSFYGVHSHCSGITSATKAIYIFGLPLNFYVGRHNENLPTNMMGFAVDGIHTSSSDELI